MKKETARENARRSTSCGMQRLRVIEAAQLDFAVAGAHGEGRLGIDCWASNDAAIGHTELRAVPGASDNAVGHRSLVKWATHVRADGTNSINGFALLQEYGSNASQH